MHIEASNMTHEEYYHINGTLSPERTEEALDALASMEAMREASDLTTDAHSGYIAEDFLSKELKELSKIAKTMRGNRLWLENVILDIREKVLAEVRNGEYGAECLKGISKALDS